MFLKQADGRKSPFHKPWSTDKRPNHRNQRSFNRRQSIPALLPCPDPRIISDVQDRRPPRAILYALRFRFAPIEHCGRRENHLVILAVSYARADNFISSFLIASRLSSLCRNQCHSAQVRIATNLSAKCLGRNIPGQYCQLTSKRNCLAQQVANRLWQSLCPIACNCLRATTCTYLNGHNLHPIRHFALARTQESGGNLAVPLLV